jgi:type I restriction enzyme M protein
MLDTATKRRIDTARDILVGKVPDPKSQVEQITIALIYKFMDDMDAESEELGGKRKFFTGDFARYGWAKLMRSGLGGHDTLALYAEGITKMPENPGIPPLFRDIFKNAYLPYRDPETLKSFLKIIDEFSYDHSERLGDAFEYLLSVLGSQGDAGQFRTPRHIIDFMVEVLDPKKTETVLDPACGTAGFLISAYKHIVRQNTDPQGNSTLTPDDRGRLAQNFRGYDISPDMVRLSLVNLYLHGFSDPHIFEYDTLTSEERWNEFADVILANPPFMSPKGGIKPHKRFSIQAKRSEVLFVDYMAEHLTPTGRAGIIVPEGIIFQSQTAYKALRKLLVENSLVAVVSLPAGCFNPYSGVKTSILILDKSLARQSDSIAFFKVENDGFGLGAQRRAFDKNDLPQVKSELAAYLQALRGQQATADLQPTCGLIVPKEKIAANGDYNLSGERYRDGGVRASSYPLVAIQEVAEVASGFGFPPDQQGQTDQEIPFLKVSDMNLPGNEIHITSWNNTVSRETLRKLGAKSFPQGTVIFPKIGAAIATNKKRILSRESTYDNNVMGIVPGNRIVTGYLYALLQSFDLSGWASDSQPPSMRKSVVEVHTFPLPPLDVQKEIVAEIEGYQKVIDGARAVLDHYRPHIPLHPDWPMVELGEVCEAIVTGPFGSALHQTDYVNDGIPVINPANIVDGTISTDGVKMVSPATRDRLQEFTVCTDDIVIGRRGEMGRCGVVTSGMTGWLCGTGSFVIRLKDVCLPRFAFFQISSPKVKQYLEEQAIGVTMKNLNQGILSAIQIPLPPLATQQAIVAEIEAEQALVAANRELIARFEQKIQTTLARVWGEAAPAVAHAAPPADPSSQQDIYNETLIVNS